MCRMIWRMRLSCTAASWWRRSVSWTMIWPCSIWKARSRLLRKWRRFWERLPVSVRLFRYAAAALIGTRESRSFWMQFWNICRRLRIFRPLRAWIWRAMKLSVILLTRSHSLHWHLRLWQIPLWESWHSSGYIPERSIPVLIFWMPLRTKRSG